MLPPADLIDRFVWAPVQEIDVPVVLAFGAAWFGIVESLGLPAVVRYGAAGEPFPQPVGGGWRLAAYRLPSGQLAVVSSQQGYAGPPGASRTEVMRSLLADLPEGSSGLAPVSRRPVSAVDAAPVVESSAVAEASSTHPPFRVGSVLRTVVLGPPGGDHVVTWDEDNSPTVWTVDRPVEYADRVGHGRTARTVVGDGRYREVGLLDPATGSLMVPDRYPVDGGALGGNAFRLSDPRPSSSCHRWTPTPSSDGLGESSWVLRAGATSWWSSMGAGSSRRSRTRSSHAARDGSGAWVSHLEAAPSPRGSRVWPRPSAAATSATLRAPASSGTVEQGALVLVEALR